VCGARRLPLFPACSNSVTNFVEVTKASGTATITRVSFYRDVLGSSYSLLGTVSSSPFRAGFSVSDLDVNTVVNILAVVTCSDGSVVYSVFSGRVREPNLAPTDIRVSVGSIQVCAECVHAFVVPLGPRATRVVPFATRRSPRAAPMTDVVFFPVVDCWGRCLLLSSITVYCVPDTPPQENLASGTVLGVLSTVDPNALDVFTYSLITPAPPNAYPSFVLVGNQVVTNKSLDFEATPTLQIIVQATDDTGAFVRKTLTINVIDTNDVSTNVQIVNITTGAAIPFVDENTAKGTVVGRLQAVDQDCCDSYRFGLVDDSKTFTLQPGPGGTTQLVTIGNINFEVLSVLTVQFTVDDDRGPSFSTYSNINVRDINEAPTDITLSMPVTRTIILNVDENATINTLVGTFSAKDPDTWQVGRLASLPRVVLLVQLL
jgi:hypothetical protein